MVSIAFIIPARNEAKHIGRCLDSIKRQEHHNDDFLTLEIVVVDNQSTDKTADIALQRGARIIQVAPGNAATARNTGAAGVECDLLAFIDADCVLPPTWLRTCWDYLACDGVVAVGAPQAPAPAGATWVERLWVDTITRPSPHPWEEVAWLPAFNLLLRQSNFAEAGCFDVSLESCEDSDLSFRLSKLGQLRLVHAPRVLHLGESQTLSEFFKREKWRSRGNFTSALRRKSFKDEWPSLCIPTGFLAAVVFVAILLAVSPILPEEFRLAIFAFSLSVAFTPIALAYRKKGLKHLLPRSLMLFIYLLARGVGPFIPSKRIDRTQTVKECDKSQVTTSK